MIFAFLVAILPRLIVSDRVVASAKARYQENMIKGIRRRNTADIVDD